MNNTTTTTDAETTLASQELADVHSALIACAGITKAFENAINHFKSLQSLLDKLPENRMEWTKEFVPLAGKHLRALERGFYAKSRRKDGAPTVQFLLGTSKLLEEYLKDTSDRPLNTLK